MTVQLLAKKGKNAVAFARKNLDLQMKTSRGNKRLAALPVPNIVGIK